MIAEYGQLALTFALVLAVLLAAVPLYGSFSGNQRALLQAKPLAIGLFIFWLVDWRFIKIWFPRYFITKSTSVWFYANLFFYFIAALIYRLIKTSIDNQSALYGITSNILLVIVVLFSLGSIFL